MLSVLMATHNGARTLPTVLDAYCRLEPPNDEWRLIVIDNGSTDNTKELIRAFAHKLPLTYVFEPKPGKNGALNTGLGHIQGDLIAFTDDDAVPHPDWLLQLRRTADAQPSFAIFGGVVLPRWETTPQPWILEWVPLSVAYALTNPAWPEGPIAPTLIFEPNSAYRRQIFEAGYRFDPAIGPSGSNYPMGSGSEFHVRLRNAGFGAWHCKRAVVEHMVREYQMNRDWLLGRAFRYGRGQYRQELREKFKSVRPVCGVPGVLLRELGIQALRVAKSALRGDNRDRFNERWNLNFLAGQAYEARQIHRLGKSANAHVTRQVSHGAN